MINKWIYVHSWHLSTVIFYNYNVKKKFHIFNKERKFNVKSRHALAASLKARLLSGCLMPTL